MRDINLQIRTSYYTLLNGNVTINSTPVPIFYAQIPAGDNDDNYILINQITNTGFNSDCNNLVNCTVQLMVVTKAQNNNSGADCDNISGQIMEIIYPNPQAKAVQITDGEVVGTTLSLDIVRTGLTDGQKVLVNRVISFQHQISINNN